MVFLSLSLSLSLSLFLWRNVEKSWARGVGWPGGELVGWINGGLLRLHLPGANLPPCCIAVKPTGPQDLDQQGSTTGIRIRIEDQDQDQQGPTIRIRIENQELDQADLNCRIEACDHLKGQFEGSRRWLFLCPRPLWDDTGANGSQTKWPVICMEVGPELCKTVKGKQQRLKSCGDKVKMLLGKTQLLCSFGFPGGSRKIQRFYVANTL